MNYLAHAYLSFNNTDLLTGNMISDYIKGRKQFDYPDKIQAGIKLHRAIDEFTDTHEATKEIKELFRPVYRLYSGAFTDVVYDYFLANDVNEFQDLKTLKDFSNQTYTKLQERSSFFPDSFARLFPYMLQDDWLYHYHTEEGMRKSFGGVARRAKYIEETNSAFQIFLSEKNTIYTCYQRFFPSVKLFAFEKAGQLLAG